MEYRSFPFVDGDQESYGIELLLGYSLSDETMSLLARAKRRGCPFCDSLLSFLLNIEHEGYDDATVRSYIMYSNELVDTYGSIKAWEKEDMVVADEPSGGLAIAGGT